MTSKNKIEVVEKTKTGGEPLGIMDLFMPGATAICECLSPTERYHETVALMNEKNAPIKFGVGEGKSRISAHQNAIRDLNK